MAPHERLRKWRGKRSQVEAGKRFGLQQSHYSEIEAGKRGPSLVQAVAIQKATKIPVSAWVRAKEKREQARA